MSAREIADWHKTEASASVDKIPATAFPSVSKPANAP
jgi:hypothetical protein